MSELFRVVDEEQLGTIIADGPNWLPAPEQFGPLRWYDKVFRCASRGCSSPTYCKLSGVPYCFMHCLKKMNELLLNLGVER
jgi:hypothetical protein